MQSGGTLVAHASLIEAGAGTTAYAIDAVGATVLLLEGCGPRGCTPTCADRDHGLATSVPGAALRMDHGVLVMDRVAVCVEGASTAVALSGDVRATVVRSFVEMGSNLVGDVRGVHASGCESLWMHDSRVSMTVGGLDAEIPFVAGVDAVNCPAFLTDDTVDGVRTNLGRRVDKAYGARCTNAACTITGSSFTGASSGLGVLEAFGLGCSSGCRYVADNVLVGAQVQTESAIGLLLQDSVAATVTRTRAVGGCGGITVGATVVGGTLRFTNNEAVGLSCTTTSSFSAGLAVEARTGAAFLSQNNSYDAGRVIDVDAGCNAAGLALRADRRFGTFQNDVFVAGECEFARAVLIENEAPAAFTHAGLVGTYYELEGDRAYSSAADLVGVFPLFVGHVFTTTPRFVDRSTSLRIQTSSPFAGAGSRLGAPRVDFAGTVRPTPPSIGAWEP